MPSARSSCRPSDREGCGLKRASEATAVFITMLTFLLALTPQYWQDPHEIRVDEESKLTLHGLLQYYVKLTEKDHLPKLSQLGGLCIRRSAGWFEWILSRSLCRRRTGS